VCRNVLYCCADSLTSSSSQVISQRQYTQRHTVDVSG
jgi:hypothetical protein